MTLFPQRAVPREAQVIPPFVHVAQGHGRGRRAREGRRLVGGLPFPVARRKGQLDECVAVRIRADGGRRGRQVQLLTRRQIIAIAQNLLQNRRHLRLCTGFILTLHLPGDRQGQFARGRVLLLHVKFRRRIVAFIRKQRVARRETERDRVDRLVHITRPFLDAHRPLEDAAAVAEGQHAVRPVHPRIERRRLRRQRRPPRGQRLGGIPKPLAFHVNARPGLLPVPT